jgi:hypothetical protein
MIRTLRAALICSVAAFLSPSLAQTQESFRFVALGDMPYGDPDVEFGPYKSLIKVINRKVPAFTVHLGDIKSGSTPCSDQALIEQLAFLNSIDGPVLYTPGDNEWTDCHRAKAGGYDPLERLTFIRKTFFAGGARSLGGTPMAVERQADAMNDYAAYVKNIRFKIAGVHVITAHVVGSNNNFKTRDLAAANELF